MRKKGSKSVFMTLKNSQSGHCVLKKAFLQSIVSKNKHFKGVVYYLKNFSEIKFIKIKKYNYDTRKKQLPHS